MFINIETTYLLTYLLKTFSTAPVRTRICWNANELHTPHIAYVISGVWSILSYQHSGFDESTCTLLVLLLFYYYYYYYYYVIAFLYDVSIRLYLQTSYFARNLDNGNCEKSVSVSVLVSAVRATAQGRQLPNIISGISVLGAFVRLAESPDCGEIGLETGVQPLTVEERSIYRPTPL